MKRTIIHVNAVMSWDSQTISFISHVLADFDLRSICPAYGRRASAVRVRVTKTVQVHRGGIGLVPHVCL
jgi:hypothetical protein